MKNLLAVTALAVLVAAGSAFSGLGTESAAADNARTCRSKQSFQSGI